MHPIKREDLKVGMVVICGDDDYEADAGWKFNSKSLKKIVTSIENDYITFGTLRGEYSDDSGPGIWFTSYSGRCEDLDHLYLVERTLDDLQPGDVLEREGCLDKIVQGVIGEIVFSIGDDENRFAAVDSITRLKLAGRKLKQPTPAPLEVTLKEVADKFGVSEIKIKE